MMAITDSNSFTRADLEVMQAAWLAETEKIEAGIDWGISQPSLIINRIIL